jgi:plastocyanin domain-containing protein
MLVINIVGIVLIILIIWWFWLSSPKKEQLSAAKKNKEISIVVQDGVYQPSTVVLNANTSNVIKFIRKDPSPCAATVIFPDFEISEELPLNKAIDVSLPAMKKGKYAFHCQMQMYKGSILVE